MSETAITKQEGGNGKELTLQQKKFVRLYVQGGGNGAKAYVGAGYSKNGKNAGASRLLANVNVSRAIQAALADAGYTPNGIRSKLMAFVVNDPRAFEPWFLGEKTLEQLAAGGLDTTVIQEILVTVKPTAQGDQVTKKLRFYDAQLAVTTLGRMLGLLDERKHLSVSGMVGVAALDLRDKSAEELATIHAALTTGQQPPPTLIEQAAAEVVADALTAQVD